MVARLGGVGVLGVGRGAPPGGHRPGADPAARARAVPPPGHPALRALPGRGRRRRGGARDHQQLDALRRSPAAPAATRPNANATTRPARCRPPGRRPRAPGSARSPSTSPPRSPPTPPTSLLRRRGRRRRAAGRAGQAAAAPAARRPGRRVRRRARVWGSTPSELARRGGADDCIAAPTADQPRTRPHRGARPGPASSAAGPRAPHRRRTRGSGCGVPAPPGPAGLGLGGAAAAAGPPTSRAAQPGRPPPPRCAGCSRSRWPPAPLRPGCRSAGTCTPPNRSASTPRSGCARAWCPTPGMWVRASRASASPPSSSG